MLGNAAGQSTCWIFQVKQYLLTVRAQDGGSESLSSTALVYMNVLDTNDNAPVFDPSSYSNEVWENATIATSILLVSATDIDDGKVRRFPALFNCDVKKITGTNTERRFVFNSQLGTPMLKIHQSMCVGVGVSLFYGNMKLEQDSKNST